MGPEGSREVPGRSPEGGFQRGPEGVLRGSGRCPGRS